MRHARLSEIPARPAARAAIERFLLELDPRDRERIASLILFGSGARGEDSAASDVDLLVVWRGSVGEALDRLIPITTRILLESGVDVSVHPMTIDTYDSIRRMRTGFYDNVEREGILVGA